MSEFSERQPEQNEYNFENGIKQAFSEIEKLLQAQEYVVVTICGSSYDVGKTKLASRIMQEISARRISWAWQSDTRSMMQKPNFTHQPETKGHVLVFGSEQPAREHPMLNKQAQDERLAEKGKKFGLPLSKIDLRIYVYRPDKPFTSDELQYADIVIRNDEAIDKPRRP